MAFAKILDFLRMLKTHSRAPRYNVLVMTEKVKSVIGRYLLLPYFILADTLSSPMTKKQPRMLLI